MNETNADRDRFEADCRAILEAAFKLRETGATESALMQETGFQHDRLYECLNALLNAEGVELKGDVYIIKHHHASMPNPIPPGEPYVCTGRGKIPLRNYI